MSDYKRAYHIDYLRILACFMVIVIHVSALKWHSVSVTSFEWKVFNFYDTLVRSAVPIFFMISGKLFLSKDAVSLKKLYKGNILKLLLVYAVWSFLYAIDTLRMIYGGMNFDLTDVISTTISSKYHLWYLPALVSVYFLIPVFIAVKNYREGKYLKYICVLFFLFGVLRTSILKIPFDEDIVILLEKFNFSLDYYCGYFVLGYVLDKYKSKFSGLKTSLLIIGFAGIVLATSAAAYFCSVAVGVATSMFYDDFFVSTYFEAVILFLVFLRMPDTNISERKEAVIRTISRYTFFVYLLHPFILEHLNLNLGFSPLSFNAIFSVPVIAAMIFVICIGMAYVIDKIPYLNRIMF